MRAGEAKLRMTLDLQEQFIRTIAGQVVYDMLTDLIDDLNMSGDEASGRAADRLERVRTLHQARIVRSAPEEPEPAPVPASRPDERGRKRRTCPVDPDRCGEILGWEAFTIHIYEVHTEGPNGQRLEAVDRILKQGAGRG